MTPSTGASTRRFGLPPLARRRPLLLAGIAALALSLGLTACEPTVQVHGHMPDADALAQIKVGSSSRENVRALMGSPTAVGTFDDKRWYFITRKTATAAFDQTEILEQQVVAIDFDDGGFVTNVERQEGLDQVQEIAMVDRITPTKGRELGFFEQVLGNFGGGRLTKKNTQPGPIDSPQPTSRRR